MSFRRVSSVTVSSLSFCFNSSNCSQFMCNSFSSLFMLLFWPFIDASFSVILFFKFRLSDWACFNSLFNLVISFCKLELCSFKSSIFFFAGRQFFYMIFVRFFLKIYVLFLVLDILSTFRVV